MSYREVRVFEVREALRLWLRGEGIRSIERMAQLDRKTVRRYLSAAEGLGLVRDGGEAQLTDEFIGQVVEAVRPHRSDGHGAPWRLLVANHDEVKAWLEAGVTAVKVQRLLARRGVVVPVRTVQRYAAVACEVGRSRRSTVPLADGAPGDECQVDFGRMGLVYDAATDRRRVCHALVFTACLSRHCFVWLSFTQTTEAVIEGFEAAWAFFGGVFRTVIPDNLKAIVETPDSTEPRFNQAFVEYAQARGFAIDAARVRRPQDKARVERNVAYVQASFFAGEDFRDLADAQARAEEWSTVVAGLRIHGRTQARPAEVFAVEERHLLLPAPTTPYDLPTYPRPLVARDHHIEVDRALYSVPGNRIGQRVDVRADRSLVRIYSRGQLVKVHARTHVGGRRTDPADLPAEKTPYAMRDVERLKAMATVHGPAVGAYAAALLDTPLPWTRMRQVYALLGLVRRWGAERVDAACARAIDAEAVSGVSLIGRMLERATEREAAPPAPPAAAARALRAGPGPLRRGPNPAGPRRRSDGVSGPAPTVSPELKALLRRVKLGKALDTLPERLALARTGGMGHAEFLELVLADEVTRRETSSAMVRARAAGLAPDMCLEHWDDSAAVTFDRHTWAELCSLRFIDGGHNVVIMGPVGVGKTFLASALGHAAVRRRYSVHFERCDRMLRRLRASRLDNSHDVEVRKLLRVDLLVIDDFALQPLDAADTTDVYELIVERHRAAATVVTSNREPVEWLGLMADPLLAQSAIDRLQSAAYELVIDGESYRRRQKPGLPPLDPQPPAPRSSRRRR